MGIGTLTLEGKDTDEQSFIEAMDTHGGLTIYVHQCYERLGIDLKVSEAIELRDYLTKYIQTYESLLERDE
jgi:hypothetical protein